MELINRIKNVLRSLSIIAFCFFLGFSCKTKCSSEQMTNVFLSQRETFRWKTEKFINSVDFMFLDPLNNKRVTINELTEDSCLLFVFIPNYTCHSCFGNIYEHFFKKADELKVKVFIIAEYSNIRETVAYFSNKNVLALNSFDFDIQTEDYFFGPFIYIYTKSTFCGSLTFEKNRIDLLENFFSFWFEKECSPLSLGIIWQRTPQQKAAATGILPLMSNISFLNGYSNINS